MLAELVFLSRFLGLTYGERPVHLRVGPEIARVELRRDDAPLATLRKAPWMANVNFGSDLGPYELTAVGFDARGEEVARDTQLINLARPRAEATIFIDRKGDSLSARMAAAHIEGREARSSILELDGRVLSRNALGKSIPLGTFSDDAIHVVSVELKFADGETVRKEIVFGGKYYEEMPAELTAVAVVQQRKDARPAAAQCIVVGGRQIAPVAVELRESHVSFVVNGAPPRWVYNLPRVMTIGDAHMHVIAPILQQGKGADYFSSKELARGLGVREALATRTVHGRKRFAEALAAAGMRALRKEERRAVVYVVGERVEPDHSGVSPAAVRDYLQRIGVPLRVWSVEAPTPELLAAWGDVVEDVSSPDKVLKAAARLGEELAAQRIAWLPGAPLDAYRATATADCAYQPLFRRSARDAAAR